MRRVSNQDPFGCMIVYTVQKKFERIRGDLHSMDITFATIKQWLKQSIENDRWNPQWLGPQPAFLVRYKGD
jgi:hypothetical protein